MIEQMENHTTEFESCDINNRAAASFIIFKKSLIILTSPKACGDPNNIIYRPLEDIRHLNILTVTLRHFNDALGINKGAIFLLR